MIFDDEKIRENQNYYLPIGKYEIYYENKMSSATITEKVTLNSPTLPLDFLDLQQKRINGENIDDYVFDYWKEPKFKLLEKLTYDSNIQEHIKILDIRDIYQANKIISNGEYELFSTSETKITLKLKSVTLLS